jgi:hypothetical protein
MNYDGERCYDFAHTISLKHFKDLATKLYKKYHHRFGIKLLTKMPKKGFSPVDGGKIASSMLHLMPILTHHMYIAYCLRRLTLIMKIQQKISTRLNLSLVRSGQR